MEEDPLISISRIVKHDKHSGQQAKLMEDI
jgi:hypothetical protein